VSHIVRRRTIGKVQELLRDLYCNQRHPETAENDAEFYRDSVLLGVLESWMEEENSTGVKPKK
jgi:hypothetical protein